MGKQINYWMDYESFVLLAQKALDLGCVIYRQKADENGKLIFGTNIEVVTEDENNYYFYLPKAGEILIEEQNGREVVDHSYSRSGNTVIEAGYSYVVDKKNNKHISRNRIYCISGYYDNDGVYIERPEVLTKVYNSLARYVKKLAPYTEFHDVAIGSRPDNYGQEIEYVHKEYVTPWCLQKKDQGYKLGV